MWIKYEQVVKSSLSSTQKTYRDIRIDDKGLEFIAVVLLELSLENFDDAADVDIRTGMVDMGIADLLVVCWYGNS